MKNLRRRNKRVGFEPNALVSCQLVHPEDQLISLRGQLLDLSSGGIGLRVSRDEVPAWVLECAVIVRADLPETGELLRRSARLRNLRRQGVDPEIGFVWDPRGAVSRAYERIQSQRLQRFLDRRARNEFSKLEFSRLGSLRESNVLDGESMSAPTSDVVRLERLPAVIM